MELGSHHPAVIFCSEPCAERRRAAEDSRLVGVQEESPTRGEARCRVAVLWAAEQYARWNFGMTDVSSRTRRFLLYFGAPRERMWPILHLATACTWSCYSERRLRLTSSQIQHGHARDPSPRYRNIEVPKRVRCSSPARLPPRTVSGGRVKHTQAMSDNLSSLRDCEEFPVS